MLGGIYPSAEWSEMAGGLTNITIHSQVPPHEFAAEEINIDIGDAEDEATRWWTSMLGQNQM